MADQIYKVRDPTGAIREIKGPAGASDEDVIRQAQILFGGTQKPADIQPTMKQSMAQELNDRLGWEKNLAGVGSAVDSAAMRLKQMVGGKLTPQETANVQDYRTMNQLSPEAQVGNIVGNIAMTAAPAASLYRGAGAVAGAAMPASVAPTLAPTVAGAVTGATTAATTQPVLQGESGLQNAGYGALGGVAGDTAARVVGRVAQPIIQSAPVQTLLRHGVVPTPGQAAGPSSFGGRLEQRAQSVLGVGDMITGGRNRAGTEFNRAAINQGVPQGQPAIQAIGDEGISQLGEAAGRNYVRQLAGRTVQVDPALVAAIDAAPTTTRLPLSAAGEARFNDLMNRLFYQRLPASGSMPATSLKAEIIGDIGHAAHQYRSSADAEQRALGAALSNARNTIQRWMLQQSGAPAREIAMADTAYGAQKAVESASDRALARGGEFTPLQLLRQAPPGSATERLAQAGQAVLPGTMPNSGTVDRATLAALLLGGGSEASHHYLGTPQYLTALALAPLAYSRTGSRYALGDLLPRIQQPVAAAARQAAPYAANAGGILEQLQRQQQ